jgi:hypothetical protein
MSPEQEFEFIKGQYHYINGGKKEELIHPYARASGKGSGKVPASKKTELNYAKPKS